MAAMPTQQETIVTLIEVAPGTVSDPNANDIEMGVDILGRPIPATALAGLRQSQHAPAPGSEVAPPSQTQRATATPLRTPPSAQELRLPSPTRDLNGLT